MMFYKKLKKITEAWDTSLKHGHASGVDLDEPVDIHKNPSNSEVAKLIHKHGEVRGMIHKPSGDHYVWNSNSLLHHDIAHHYNLDEHYDCHRYIADRKKVSCIGYDTSIPDTDEGKTISSIKNHPVMKKLFPAHKYEHEGY